MSSSANLHARTWKGVALLARIAIAGIAVALVPWLAPDQAHAQNATWIGATSDYGTATNWTPNNVPDVPTETAIFGNTGQTSINVSATVAPAGFTFDAGAPSYAVSAVGANTFILFFGAGISNNSGQVQNINATGSTNGLIFFGAASAGFATSYNLSNGSQINFFDTSSGGNARVNLDNGVLGVGLSSGGLSLGSLSSTSGGFVVFSNAGGSGAATQSLTVGSLNSNTTFAGAMTEQGAVGSLNKVGTGILTLQGANTYTGTTTVNAGVLNVEGSIASSQMTTVNSAAMLTGSGMVGNTTVASGGAFAPGNGAPGSSMSISGNLVLQSGAQYMVQLNRSTASFASVSGGATLGGATLNASFAPDSYVEKQYTILKATGGVTGSFSSVVNTNLPSGFHTSLSTDPNNAYLNLALDFVPPPDNGFVPPPNSGLSLNQRRVADAIVGFFDANGRIPIAFGGLTPAGLTQVSGETATGAQQTTFNAMNLFMSTLTDPFVSGRGAPISAGGSPTAYVAENPAYATSRVRSAGERDAYAAVYTKAPASVPFEQRWSVWAAGFGGSQTTSGNASVGSNNTASSIYGTAVGADYRVSPDTLAGFALAGGGTNFNVNGLGGGRSDLFQAGAFVRHNLGPAYVTGALAYGWQDITTDRTLTAAGVDRLRAEFNANAWSGRLEGGYRFVTPWLGGVGIAPYAAGQFTTFDLPAYAENILSGVNTFALSYSAKSVTDTRTELGLRADKSFALQDGVLTLRGRAAWAHDFDPHRGVLATFQALPGASFVVDGAALAPDAALTTASVEMRWLNGWSAAAIFEGEFSDVTESYAGKAVVRYAW